MIKVNENKNVNDTRDYKEGVVAKWNNCLLREGCFHPIYKPSLTFNWYDVGAISRIEKQSLEQASLPPTLQSWTLIICTFTISTGFRTTSEVGGSFYIYKS